MEDRIDEILRRLEALEQRVNELSRNGETQNDSQCPFRAEERRIVDLIVRLTAERVEQAHAERSEHHGPQRDERRGRRDR